MNKKRNRPWLGVKRLIYFVMYLICFGLLSVAYNNCGPKKKVRPQTNYQNTVYNILNQKHFFRLTTNGTLIGSFHFYPKEKLALLLHSPKGEQPILKSMGTLSVSKKKILYTPLISCFEPIKNKTIKFEVDKMNDSFIWAKRKGESAKAPSKEWLILERKYGTLINSDSYLKKFHEAINLNLPNVECQDGEEAIIAGQSSPQNTALLQNILSSDHIHNLRSFTAQFYGHY